MVFVWSLCFLHAGMERTLIHMITSHTLLIHPLSSEGIAPKVSRRGSSRFSMKRSGPRMLSRTDRANLFLRTEIQPVSLDTALVDSGSNNIQKGTAIMEISSQLGRRMYYQRPSNNAPTSPEESRIAPCSNFNRRTTSRLVSSPCHPN